MQANALILGKSFKKTLGKKTISHLFSGYLHKASLYDHIIYDINNINMSGTRITMKY